MDGFQVGKARMSLARLVKSSKNGHHSGGHREPPKVSLRDMNTVPSTMVELAPKGKAAIRYFEVILPHKDWGKWMVLAAVMDVV